MRLESIIGLSLGEIILVNIKIIHPKMYIGPEKLSISQALSKKTQGGGAQND